VANADVHASVHSIEQCRHCYPIMAGCASHACAALNLRSHRNRERMLERYVEVIPCSKDDVLQVRT
jgi:hypothetical protein